MEAAEVDLEMEEMDSETEEVRHLAYFQVFPPILKFILMHCKRVVSATHVPT